MVIQESLKFTAVKHVARVSKCERIDIFHQTPITNVSKHMLASVHWYLKAG